MSWISARGNCTYTTPCLLSIGDGMSPMTSAPMGESYVLSNCATIEHSNALFLEINMPGRMVQRRDARIMQMSH